MGVAALACAVAFPSVHIMYGCLVKNSAHIRRPLTSPEIHAFATGYGTKRRAGSIQVAWLLENAALDRGWPIGHSLGSEAEFIQRFQTSRDVVRGAIRLVESRGFMRMQRGCKGGLRLLRPDLEHAASAFAAYLSAAGYSRAKLDGAVQTVAPLLREMQCGTVVDELLKRIAPLLSEDAGAGRIEGAQAEIVATRLLRQVVTPIPAAGVALGNESELRAKFGIGHRTFRQTLCILDDLGMLQVKRGRGGGYGLQRPAAIGVIRRLFALLASRGMRAKDGEQVVWALGIANLRLVCRRMEMLDANERAEWCDRLYVTLSGLADLKRWVALQQGLARIADDLLLSTLTSCMLAYLGRIGHAPSADGQLGRRLAAAEEGILEALRDGRPTEAECHLRAAQTVLANQS